ncbi:pilus assembly protein [Oceanimonas sp. NS1]|uniref:Pilus assembly protein n=1 Tax=Oceanimonas doudoroffii TaxID=84158 RepID=A0A233RG09_9GAMM|nr:MULTISPECIES: pilus assembly protein [Oceanimonas]MCT7656266.1 pilus assembly protein [Oceanimonas sp. NS1]NHI01863.1 hypothetical protein [Oceanimonas sp. MB9]OXY82329.1 pilus assembly protein [Oceanimonas doudoroffii]
MFIAKELLRLVNDEDGLTMVEYAVAGALIAAGAATAFTNLGEAVEEEINGLCTTIGAASGGSCTS